jgi:hypothetical protein
MFIQGKLVDFLKKSGSANILALREDISFFEELYFTISLFFQRRFLLRHFLHFTAVSAFLEPQSRQIFM